MPQSKKRGGAKAHRKRVARRNALIKSDRKKLEKAYSDMMQKTFEEYQQRMSGMTESVENSDTVVPEFISEFQPVNKTV